MIPFCRQERPEVYHGRAVGGHRDTERGRDETQRGTVGRRRRAWSTRFLAGDQSSAAGEDVLTQRHRGVVQQGSAGLSVLLARSARWDSMTEAPPALRLLVNRVGTRLARRPDGSPGGGVA